ncbi:hypothetical protein [Ralstonia phage vB_RsoP_BMB50]|uniref:dATP/dGTP diphosphohydrolase N-terminal domain-containing protein n=1 Tax=Ralstonia phage vB_RsoP_BMB50 TaxID=2834269 RepID=A0A8E5KHD8_9CAUD|nr:hypothetical protein [Ralstonia phage vB_RsoP_BMB50]
MSAGMKFDGGKPRMDLLFDGMPNALLGIGDVLTFGAKKYADHSWQKVENAQARYSAALIRHQLAISKGETNDPESGLPHAYHLACNALFLAEFAALALQRAQCSERAVGAEPVQCAPRPADDSRGDGELVGDARAVGGSAVGTPAIAKEFERAVADHGSGVRRVSELAQQLKQKTCQHAFTWSGYDMGRSVYTCTKCQHTELRSTPSFTGGL